jgi:hypothetical protein
MLRSALRPPSETVLEVPAQGLGLRPLFLVGAHRSVEVLLVAIVLGADEASRSFLLYTHTGHARSECPLPTTFCSEYTASVVQRRY